MVSVRWTSVAWGVLAVSLVATAAWALYVVRFYLFLARAFPAQQGDGGGVTGLVASIQGYAVAFGPLAASLIIAALFNAVTGRRKARP